MSVTGFERRHWALFLTMIAGCLWALSATASQTQLRVTSHAGSIDGLLANSHLIASHNEALLIDAQLTRSDAQQVVAMIKKSRIKRLTVFITHGHPDHYLGLAEIVDAFPRTRVFSNTTTATAIARNGIDARDFWKRSLGTDIAERVVIPEVYRFPKMDLGGNTIRIIDIHDAESVLPSVLYLKKRGWLFTGDTVFSGVHLWLAENRPKQWWHALVELGRLGPINTVYPGHGETGPVGLIERNQTYLTRFMELSQKAENADQLFDGMDELYLTHRLPFFLRRATEITMGGTRQ